MKPGRPDARRFMDGHAGRRSRSIAGFAALPGETH